MERAPASVFLPSLWASHSPKDFHQNNEVSHLRLQGLRIVIYIDDILLMASSQSQVTEHSQMLLNLLKNLGFVINQSHSIEFLGLMIDSESLTFKVPEEKIRKVQKECRHFLNKGVASPHDISHLIGRRST